MSDFIHLDPTDIRAILSKRPVPDSNAKSEDYRHARRAVEKYIFSSSVSVGWNSVIGNESAKNKIRQAIEAPVKHKDTYSFYGMQCPKGILLHGHAGCGKTLIAKAAATSLAEVYGTDVEFLSISGPQLQERFIGATEQNIKAIFDFAKIYKKENGHPLLVFIDEAETILPDRGGVSVGHGKRMVQSWEQSQVAAFLAEMDGMSENCAFLLLATNMPHQIDPAILRDGRIDHKIQIERPNQEAVQQIVRNSFEGIPAEDAIDDIVFAATETFFDPMMIIKTSKAVKLKMGFDEEGEQFAEVEDEKHFNFCLEHIISGAMAASVARRCKALAFDRDIKLNKISGIRVADAIRSVNDIFEENKNLDHSAAIQDFTSKMAEKLNIKEKKKKLN